IEAAGRKAELFGRHDGGQRTLAKSRQYMTDECRGVTMDKLLVLFKGTQYSPAAAAPSVFSSGSVRSPSSKTDGAAREHSCFENYIPSPVLLAPRQEKGGTTFSPSPRSSRWPEGQG